MIESQQNEALYIISVCWFYLLSTGFLAFAHDDGSSLKIPIVIR